MNSLQLYKNLLKKASRMSDKHAAQTAKEQIRSSFKTSKSVTDPNEIEKLYKVYNKVGQDKLKLLSTLVPKDPKEFTSGKQVFTVKGGQVIEGSADKKGFKGAVDYRIDDESLDRHYRLLRRQYFMDRK